MIDSKATGWRALALVAAVSVTSEARGTEAETAEALQTVVVFGTRDPTPSQSLTSLTTVVSGERLNGADQNHPTDYLQTVPGLWVSRGNGQEHLTALRSPVFTGAGSCGAFWMGEEGIALRAKGFCNANQLFDAHFEIAQSVEVYKGPYAALFGSNAQFGGLHLVLPDPREVPAAIGLQGDSLGYRRLQLQGAGVGEHQALAAWLTAVDDDGWRADSGYSQQKFNVKHVWSGQHWEAETGLALMHLEQETAGYVIGPNAYKDDRLARGNDNPEAFRDADAMRLYSRWRLEQGNSQWTITPYLRANSMAFRMHFVPWQPLEKNAHESVGATVQWQWNFAGDATLTWLFESEFTDGELSEFQESPAPFSPQNFPEGMHYDYQVDATSIGTGVQLDLPIGSRWLLDAALRWDSDRYDYRTREPAGWDCAAGVSGCRFFRPEDQDNHFENVSAGIGMNFRVSQHFSLFSRAASGFRIPQATELYRAQAADITGIESERIDSIEWGARAQGDAWKAELAAYVMTNKDGIYQDPMRNYVNGVETDHQGLEYDLVWWPSPQWQLRLSGEFARHTYANNPSTLGVDDTNDIKGNRIDTAPNHQAAAELRWRASANIDVALQWSQLGRYYLDPENNWRYPGHELLGLTAQWRLGDWRVFASVENLLDRQYAERADVSFDELRYFPGEALNMALGVTWTWR